jgi:hypothetical protein
VQTDLVEHSVVQRCSTPDPSHHVRLIAHLYVLQIHELFSSPLRDFCFADVVLSAVP